MARVKKKKPGNAGSNDVLLRGLDQLKRLLMLQLVASGVKPVDIALTLGVAKSAMSGMIPVRKLSIGRRQATETLLDVEASEVTRRLDTLIALERKRKTEG
jgi:hypothetical protein